MARIRTIKPEFWKHPVMARLEPHTRLIAAALFSIADDEGFFRAEPELVRGEIDPFENDLQKISGILQNLSEGFRKNSGIKWIEIREHPEQGKIGLICEFTKHQKISHPSPSKLKRYWQDAQISGILQNFPESSGIIPEPSRITPNSSGNNPESSGISPERSTLDQGSGIRDQGKEHIYTSWKVENDLDKSDKTELSSPVSNTIRQDNEVESINGNWNPDPINGSTLNKIQYLIEKVAQTHIDFMAAPMLAMSIEKAYCREGVDVDAVIEQIQNDLVIRGDDIQINNWMDVSRFLNAKFRDYSRRYKKSSSSSEFDDPESTAGLPHVGGGV